MISRYRRYRVLRTDVPITTSPVTPNEQIYFKAHQPWLAFFCQDKKNDNLCSRHKTQVARWLVLFWACRFTYGRYSENEPEIILFGAALLCHSDLLDLRTDAAALSVLSVRITIPTLCRSEFVLPRGRHLSLSHMHTSGLVVFLDFSMHFCSSSLALLLSCLLFLNLCCLIIHISSVTL